MDDLPASVDVVDRSLPPGDLWVFGYGSLLWNPGFDHLEGHMARLHGLHRSLCVWSWWHRGSRQSPGLVLGLDLGGSCIGRVYRVAEKDRRAALAYLAAREMVTPVYLPTRCRVSVADRRLSAITFTVDRRHPQYAGRLSVAEAHAVVAQSVGHGGHNRDYIARTVEHLLTLGVRDRFLIDLNAELGAVQG